MKKGDKFTINAPTDFNAMMCTRDCTEGRIYTIESVGIDPDDSTDSRFDDNDLFFTDDEGDTVQLPSRFVTLVK